MKTRITLFTGLMLTSLTLAGCGQSKYIAQVKAMPFPTAPQLSIGQVLDHRKVCSSVKWDTIVTDSGVKTVEYRCFFKDPKSTSALLVAANDIYQWVITPSGALQVGYIGTELRYANGGTQDFGTDKANNPDYYSQIIETLASDNEVTTAGQWNSQFRVYQAYR